MMNKDLVKGVTTGLTSASALSSVAFDKTLEYHCKFCGLMFENLDSSDCKLLSSAVFPPDLMAELTSAITFRTI